MIQAIQVVAFVADDKYTLLVEINIARCMLFLVFLFLGR